MESLSIVDTRIEQPEVTYALPRVGEILEVYQAQLQSVIDDYVITGEDAEDFVRNCSEPDEGQDICYCQPSPRKAEANNESQKALVVREPGTLVKRVFQLFMEFMVAFGEAQIRREEQKMELNEFESRRIAAEWAKAEKEKMSLWAKVRLFFRQSGRSMIIREINSDDTEK